MNSASGEPINPIANRTFEVLGIEFSLQELLTEVDALSNAEAMASSDPSLTLPLLGALSTAKALLEQDADSQTDALAVEAIISDAATLFLSVTPKSDKTRDTRTEIQGFVEKKFAKKIREAEMVQERSEKEAQYKQFAAQIDSLQKEFFLSSNALKGWTYPESTHDGRWLKKCIGDIKIDGLDSSYFQDNEAHYLASLVVGKAGQEKLGSSLSEIATLVNAAKKVSVGSSRLDTSLLNAFYKLQELYEEYGDTLASTQVGIKPLIEWYTNYLDPSEQTTPEPATQEPLNTDVFDKSPELPIEAFSKSYDTDNKTSSETPQHHEEIEELPEDSLTEESILMTRLKKFVNWVADTS